MRYLVVLLLAGCAATGPEFDSRVDGAFDSCTGIGLTPGTEAHYRCVERTLGVQQPQTTTCRPDGLGGVRCRTR